MAAVDTLDIGLKDAGRGSSQGILFVYTATMFVSALLLFGIQPMFAKIVLPRLGGSPAVWSVALVFFQAMLLLGYAYAHLLARFVAPRLAVFVHVVVMSAGIVFLPISYPAGFEDVPRSGLSIWLLALFAAGVGFPFFAVSANAPLLQHWFSRSGHPHSVDPYFLYGASNVGSFAALFTYPFIMEPLLGLDAQTRLWSWGYGALTLFVLGCGMLMVRLLKTVTEGGASGMAAIQTGSVSEDADAPGWRQRLFWIGLSMVPSGLLVSVTASITTDLAAAPFLWVAPLALFLLTFVITFQRNPSIRHETVLKLHSLLIAPIIVVMFASFGHISMIVVHLMVFFVSAMVCHGELFARRPKARYLTEFYLYMSLGGVLGGLFASLIAPQIFDRVLEYPILLLLVFLCRRDALDAVARFDLRDWWPAALLAVGGLGLLLLRGADAERVILIGAIPVVVGLLLLQYRRPFSHAFIVCLGIMVSATLASHMEVLDRDRSFFGVLSILSFENDGKFHLLKHGTTLHGAEQWTDEKGGKLTGRPVPLTYYYDKSPLAISVNQLRDATGTLDNVALVGVGTGAMACHRKAGEAWRFYEIDPDVIKFARDTRYFRFLSECGESAGMVIGDGRISLAKEPDAKFDVIVLDAFSSDTVPAHLMTREAMALYFDKLTPNGAIVLHISNRHMDLKPIVAALAKDQGAIAYTSSQDSEIWSVDMDKLRFKSTVAVVSKDKGRLRHVAADERWIELKAEPDAQPWTDNYTNIAGALFKKLMAGK